MTQKKKKIELWASLGDLESTLNFFKSYTLQNSPCPLGIKGTKEEENEIKQGRVKFPTNCYELVCSVMETL